jgi:hypothetical protein
MKVLCARANCLVVMICLLALLSPAQEAPIERTFRPGDREIYGVAMTLLVEVHKVSLETSENKTYVQPVTQSSTARLEWTETRKIESVAPDGTAKISESLADFQAHCGEKNSDREGDPALQKAFGEFCAQSHQPHDITFHEQSNGLIPDLPPHETIYFGESSPLLLTLWLRHAVHPTAILPDQPFVLGAPSRRTISSALDSSLPNARGSQTTEWLGSAEGPSTARLHVVQDMTWTSLARNREHASVPRDADAKESFFADSLSTISLLDGSVLSATRSASRETRWTLAPVPGLSQPPEFRVKLSVTVTIRKIA